MEYVHDVLVDMGFEDLTNRSLKPAADNKDTADTTSSSSGSSSSVSSSSDEFPVRGKYFRRDEHCADVMFVPRDQRDILNTCPLVQNSEIVLQVGGGDRQFVFVRISSRGKPCVFKRFKQLK